METYVICKNCEEKNSTNFSYCRKCGAELLLRNGIPESSQENILSPNTKEKADFDHQQQINPNWKNIDEINNEEELKLEDQKCKKQIFSKLVIK